jgi:hypothetical protein
MKNTAKQGTLIERVSGCELRIEIKVGQYVWNMYSEKTGCHSISEPIERGMDAPRPSKRVRAHWDGFLSNQTR